MLFQADGDALVMAGEFQSEFWHGVPERASWSELRSRSMFDEMQLWQQLGLIDEIKRHKKGGGWWAACAEELHYQVARNTLG